MQVTVDTRQFDTALNEYLKYNRRDLPQILNKTAKDVGLLTAKNLKLNKVPTTYQINLLRNKEWWIKYVVTRIKKGMKLKQKKNKKGKVINRTWQKTVSDVSKKIIATRKSSVTLLASGFLKSARNIKANNTVSEYAPKGHDKAIGWANTANNMSSKQFAQLNVAYDVEGKTGAVSFAFPYLQKAMDNKAKDMWVYIQRKIKENGEKIKGKGI